MFKKLFFAFAALMLSMGLAFAQVDVNKATQAELDGVKGIGPSISKKIVDERTKGGNFKDWADLETRVKGIGEKNSAKMSQAGLTVGGQSKSGASTKQDKKASKSVKPASAPAAAAASAPAKAGAKADKKAKAEADKKAKADAKAEKKAKAEADKKAKADAKAAKKAKADADKKAKADAKAAKKTKADADKKVPASAPAASK